MLEGCFSFTVEGEGIMTVVSGTSCEVQFIHCSNRLKLSLF